MTREDKDSLVEMLAKIPITETRGSLLSAIGKLLRVIDISESSIMIPTLLKDKCEFDAYEMLTLAKILKASILGHNDLVEFYMSESSSQLNSFAAAQHQQYLQHQHNKSLQSTSSSLRSSSESSTQSSSIPSTPIPTSSSASPATGNSSSAESLMKMGSSTHSSSSQLSTNKQIMQLHVSNHQQHLHHHHHLMVDDLHGRRQQRLQLQHNNGDPDATLRLLLQIEQLKTFIPQVTGLFESIIELYKNSVDTITYQTSRSTHK